MKDSGIMSLKKVFIAEALSQDSTEDSLAMELQSRALRGIFSIYVVSAGSGTLTFTYKLSYDDITYITPAAAVTIKTGHTAGSDIISFGPIIAPFIKITATEVDVNTITSLDVTLCIQ